MKKFFMKNLLKKLCIIAFFIYITVVFIGQQETLASYNSQQQYYLEKIDEAELHNKTLIETKEKLDNNEKNTRVSREKLDMYSENERVYININK